MNNMAPVGGMMGNMTGMGNMNPMGLKTFAETESEEIEEPSIRAELENALF